MTSPSLHTAAVDILAEDAWPGPGDGELPPPLSGFVVSAFSPMASAAADRCLEQVHGTLGTRTPTEPAAETGDGRPGPGRPAARTAIVLATRGGDLETHTATAVAVDAGKSAAPLLFFQSVPNAVVGHIAKRWELTGPVICFSPDDATGDPLGEALDITRSLVAGGDAEEALVLLVEQAGPDGGPGSARALLVRPAPGAGEGS
ncbi:hypothetical protein J7E97_33140 [Streptomyces sp. ISL-66]|uniref:hypothetical protein n=1 Tax=Streptomyces sp. ISL-66 TaxID=2819186 RepID=UPI001BEBCC12|nr:hypothetical protein [Streptomyces sp. ISL-66]MBT2472569.1 hypothetical protein [Streptomyces sp. ISL-66]